MAVFAYQIKGLFCHPGKEEHTVYYRTVCVTTKKGVLFDHTVRLTGYYQKRFYPEPLRLVGFYDKETKKELVFLTNHFSLAAYTITQIYKARWQIEIFFKWIKQNLKIKSFLGTSKNAADANLGCYVLLSVAFLHNKISDKICLYDA